MKKVIVITLQDDTVNVSLRDSKLSYTKEIRPNTNPTSRELVIQEFINNAVNTILNHSEAALELKS